MENAQFIGGDWGTSHLRLFLCDDEGQVLATADGPGAAACGGRFAEVFARAVAPWTTRAPLPALLCGMVGSRQGWQEAPYLRCPARLDELGQASIEAAPGVRLLPGLRCTNPLDAADFLRGEETQVLGALALDARLRHGRHLLVLPGTHSKWLQLADAQVQHFQTVVTGEVYAALRSHSVLVSAANPAEEVPLDGTFLLGLVRARTSSPDSLLAQLFECRARRLSGEFPPGDESNFLSGLLIGHELNHGLRQLAAGRRTRICLVGAAALTRRYAYALSVFGVEADCVAGSQAAVAGLAAAYRACTTEEG